MAVDERGVCICYVRRDLSSMQRKAAKKEAGRLKRAASRLDYEQNQKATYYYCSYLGHQNEVIFVGENSESHPKSGPFIFMRLFRIRGPISTWEGVRER